MPNDLALWGSPVSLRSSKNEIPEFPLRCLPPTIRGLAESIAVSTSTDPAMSAAALLSALSYCFSGLYKMEGKAGHQESLNLYTLIIAEPAERKSPVMRYVRDPFDEFTATYHNSEKKELFEAEERHIQLRTELDQKRKSKTAPAELAEIRENIELLEKKKPLRTIIDDATPEVLAELLNEHSSLLMLSDEAGILKNFTGRYSNGIPNLDLLLKSWGGDRYQKGRCNGCSISLANPLLSICVCGQPFILNELMSSEPFRASGMTARLLYVFPKSKIGERKYETPSVDEKLLDEYGRIVDYSLYNKLYMYSYEHRVLHFTPEASAYFASYYNTQIEPKLKTEFAECSDWGGKFHGLVLRLCGLLHCIAYMENRIEPNERAVNVDTLVAAICIAEYFKACAIYAYSCGAVGEQSEAEYVLNKIKQSGKRSFSKRELMQMCRRFSKMEQLTRPTEMLIEYGWIREAETKYCGSGRRPTQQYEVNPILFQES